VIANVPRSLRATRVGQLEALPFVVAHRAGNDLDLLAGAGPDTTLMLDLKGRDRRLVQRVHAEIARHRRVPIHRRLLDPSTGADLRERAELIVSWLWPRSRRPVALPAGASMAWPPRASRRSAMHASSTGLSTAFYAGPRLGGSATFAGAM
jgi:hypothetical protein